MVDNLQLTTADLAALRSAVGRRTPAADDRERIDRIRLLEELKGSVAAAQAAETAAFVASQRALSEQRDPDRPERRLAAQIGLARRISPHAAARYLRFACLLSSELPGTFAALAEGRTSEWRALLVARETAWLSPDDRASVDRELAPKLERLGDRRVEREVRALACRLDPEGAAERARSAERDRRVTLRPAPDSMVRLTALLPLPQGVACYAALNRAAARARNAGDSRGRGQVMADTLVERVTGQARADDVPVEVHLVMSDETLLNGGADPGHLSSGDPIPAPIARALACGNTDAASPPAPSARRWIRRLFQSPGTGRLVAMETRRRVFTEGQRRFVQLRDQTCRTPWCDAPIREIDHVIPYRVGGPTSVANAAGLCEACNHAKEAPGWSTRPSPTDPSAILITTPTGHEYVSRPPELPGSSAREPSGSESPQAPDSGATDAEPPPKPTLGAA